jgi:hypothetical protein
MGITPGERSQEGVSCAKHRVIPAGLSHPAYTSTCLVMDEHLVLWRKESGSIGASILAHQRAVGRVRVSIDLAILLYLVIALGFSGLGIISVTWARRTSINGFVIASVQAFPIFCCFLHDPNWGSDFSFAGYGLNFLFFGALASWASLVGETSATSRVNTAAATAPSTKGEGYGQTAEATDGCRHDDGLDCP